ncbi:hypothetical protein [Macrococcus brunensis]|uniref:hypothetical protein n=1 Tax=Macrococcus brunensis TaxID=198483 RepID=UPI001EF1295C|nr:hypothetical protein [Macrococcus brunensis]ULG71622.1 hypothetical protein MGG12_10005 [Macrococcus brunensis]
MDHHIARSILLIVMISPFLIYAIVQGIAEHQMRGYAESLIDAPITQYRTYLNIGTPRYEGTFTYLYHTDQHDYYFHRFENGDKVLSTFTIGDRFYGCGPFDSQEDHKVCRAHHLPVVTEQ